MIKNLRGIEMKIVLNCTHQVTFTPIGELKVALKQIISFVKYLI